MHVLILNCSPVRNGATAEIVRLAAAHLSGRYRTKTICIDDYSFGFCKGCRTCHETAVCMQQDDIPVIMQEFEQADIIISVSPSYWADVPGQFKAFIDRCTPWCNTHEPHAAVRRGKRGYCIALRTGPGMHECEQIIRTVTHFYGHLEIPCCGSLGLCGVEQKADVAAHQDEIAAFCAEIIQQTGCPED